ncbi:hypothetical protein CPB86DRAFT_826310 [Serendipita vermifera]|nr:hypothetical protein CPB86DRAFT_826310 [Serendipita vermifera]
MYGISEFGELASTFPLRIIVRVVEAQILRTLNIFIEIRDDETFKEVTDSLEIPEPISFLSETIESTGMPYWTIPDDSHPIPATQREYWVTSSSKNYFLAMLRTAEEDRPIIIDATSMSTQSALSLVTKLLPDIPIHSLALYGDDKDIREFPLNIAELQNMKTYPTVLFIDSCPPKSPVKLLSLSQKEEQSIPTILASTYSQANKLLERSRKKKSCSHQALHLSRAALHLVVTLRNVLENDSRATDPHKLDRILELNEIIRRISEAFDDPEFLPENKERSLQLYMELSGQHYGALPVRRSFPLLRRFQNWDLQRSQKLSPKGPPALSSQTTRMTEKASPESLQTPLPLTTQPKDSNKPNDLHATLDRAMKRHRINQANDEYMMVLKLIFTAYEPFHHSTINRFLNISNALDIVEQSFTDIAEFSGEDHLIRFYHPSIRKFWEDPQVLGQFHIEYIDAHLDMAVRCLAVLNEELRYDMAKLSGSSNSTHTSEAFRSTCLNSISPWIQYSCKFWGVHVTNAGKRGSQLRPAIEAFFQEKLLDWLYMVALCDMYDSAIFMLQRLIFLEISEDIRRFSMETKRLLKLKWETIKPNPLKIYHEFIYAPPSSIFRQVYSKLRSFPHPMATIGHSGDWAISESPSPYVIEALCLSPLENTLVTAGCKAGSPVFSIWDAETADCTTSLHPCGTHKCTVYHLSFDRDSAETRLRTGCACGKLCLWDISSRGAFLLNEFQIPSSGMCKWWAEDGSKTISMTDTRQGVGHATVFIITGISVPHCELYHGQKEDRWIFSPGQGAKVICLGEQGKLLVCWECSSGERLFKKSLPLHETFYEVSFSPDSRSILYTFEVGTSKDSVELISSHTGALLWSHIEIKLRALRYNPNLNEIVVLTTRNISTINPSDGSTTHTTTFQAAGLRPSSQIHDMSFSSDGKKVAISLDGYMQVFDRNSGDCLMTYRFDSQSFNHCLFLWSRSLTIRGSSNSVVFCPVRLDSPPVVDEVSKMLTSKLCLSPNGDYLLTAQLPNQLNLWNTISGVQIPIPRNPHISYYNDVEIKFSEDSLSVMIYNSSIFRLENIKDMNTIVLSLGIQKGEFFPRSNRIFIWNISNAPRLLSSSGSLEKTWEISSLPYDRVTNITISNTERIIALVYWARMVLVQIVPQERIVASFEGSFCGGGFSSDDSRLCVAQIEDGTIVVSCINILTEPMTRHHTTILDHPMVGSVPTSLYSIQSSYTSTKTFTCDGRAILGVNFRDHWSFFDCSDGRRVIPALLNQRHSSIYYGDYWLLDLPPNILGNVQVGQERIAYVDNDHAVVLDLSLLINDIRSKPGFIETKEIWRTDWLQGLERPKFGTVMSDMKASRILECIRHFGPLEDVLTMIKSGEQGSPLQKRVANIRKDPLLMNMLANMWKGEATDTPSGSGSTRPKRDNKPELGNDAGIRAPISARFPPDPAGLDILSARAHEPRAHQQPKRLTYGTLRDDRPRKDYYTLSSGTDLSHIQSRPPLVAPLPHEKPDNQHAKAEGGLLSSKPARRGSISDDDDDDDDDDVDSVTGDTNARARRGLYYRIHERESKAGLYFG